MSERPNPRQDASHNTTFARRGLVLGLFSASLLAIGCTPDDTSLGALPAPRTTLDLAFHHTIGGEDLTLGKTFTTRFGEDVTFSHLRYWVSQVALARGDEVFDVPGSYFLVEQTEDHVRLSVPITGVPAGSYDRLIFHIGVDPAHNASLDMIAGELAAGIGMDWSWDSGYKFLRTEGTFVQGAESGKFSFHTGDNVLYKRLEATLPAPIELVEDQVARVDLEAQVDTIFENLDLATEAQVAGGPLNSPAAKVADNYAEMFWAQNPAGEAVHFAASSPNAHLE